MKISPFLVAFLAIFFGGCADKIMLEKRSINPASFSIKCADNEMFLNINSELEFALFNAALLPIAAKKYENGRFINSKFMPPNSRYDELFIAIYEMILKEQNELYINGCEVRRVENIFE